MCGRSLFEVWKDSE